MEKVVFLENVDCEVFLPENYREYREEFSKLPDLSGSAGQLLEDCMILAWRDATLRFCSEKVPKYLFEIDLRKIFAALNVDEYRIYFARRNYEFSLYLQMFNEYESDFIAYFARALQSELNRYGSKKQLRKLDKILRSLSSFNSHMENYKIERNREQYLQKFENFAPEWPAATLRI